MNILLDTQALLWFVLDDARLSTKAQESIVAADGLVALRGFGDKFRQAGATLA